MSPASSTFLCFFFFFGLASPQVGAPTGGGVGFPLSSTFPFRSAWPRSLREGGRPAPVSDGGICGFGLWGIKAPTSFLAIAGGSVFPLRECSHFLPLLDDPDLSEGMICNFFSPSPSEGKVSTRPSPKIQETVSCLSPSRPVSCHSRSTDIELPPPCLSACRAP